MLIDNLDVSTLGPFSSVTEHKGGGGVRGSQLFREIARFNTNNVTSGWVGGWVGSNSQEKSVT